MESVWTRLRFLVKKIGKKLEKEDLSMNFSFVKGEEICLFA